MKGTKEITPSLEKIKKVLGTLELDDQVTCLNFIKKELHKISPFKNEPVDFTFWVKADLIQANDYNPNKVAPPEMKLLQHSIKEDGYTQPIVTWPTSDRFEVIDGFHRNRVGREDEEIKTRIHGYLPVVVVNEISTERGNRISSTVRHNRARGKHTVDGMAEIVLELKRRNWSDKKIAKDLGMDPDEVLRLSQITGLADIFKDQEFTKAWEADSINLEDNLDDQLDVTNES